MIEMSRVISPNDEMNDGNLDHYFAVSESALRSVRLALAIGLLRQGIRLPWSPRAAIAGFVERGLSGHQDVLVVQRAPCF
jgi:hypothetical protein